MMHLSVVIARFPAALVLAVLFIGCSLPVKAESLNLPAQPLSVSLSQLASTAKVQIVVKARGVTRWRAPAVAGALSVDEALARLLEGSGLQARREQKTTYVITVEDRTLPEAAGSEGGDTILPGISVHDRSVSDGKSFLADAITSATRTDTPLGLTPQSIQVINAAQMESQQLQTVSDALAYAGGVTVSDSGSGQPMIYIHGFTAATMSNGNVNTGMAGSLLLPVAGVDRIEVLKGADSILSGAMSPGGIVNVVSKQPTSHPIHQLTVQAGSYGEWLTSMDLGGALAKDGHWSYRLVVSGERQGVTYGGYRGNRTFYAAPSIAWKSGGTHIVMGYQRQVTRRTPLPFVLVGEHGPEPFNGRPTPNGSALLQSDTVYVDFKQKFLSLAEFESKVQYQSYRQQSGDSFYTPFRLASRAPDVVSYLGSGGIQESSGLDADSHLKVTWRTGPVKQLLLIGFDYNLYRGSSNASTYMLDGPYPAKDLPKVPAMGTRYPFGAYSNKGYLQDQITWGSLHLLLSIAHNNAWSTGEGNAAWTPNFGVLYQLTPEVAVYANSQHSFMAQNILLANGSMAPPLKGNSIEAGLKLNLVDDTLVVTADAYRNAITNMVQQLAGSDRFILVGGQVTRGFEASATGHVTKGLDLVANYVYAQMSSGINLVPKHSGSLWATYAFDYTPLRGWGLGLGIQARSGVGLAGEPILVGGQARTDASIFYHAKRWSASLGLKNVFNRALYQSFVNSGTVVIEPGRLFMLTTTYDF